MPFLPDGTPGGHRAQPARRAEPHERGPDPGDPPRLGRADPRASRPRRRSSRARTRPRSACCCGWPGFRWAAESLRLRTAGAAIAAPTAITRMVHGPQEGRAGGRARHRCSRPASRMLGARGASAETKELFQQVRDVPDRGGARSWRERELAQRRQEVGVPPGRGRAATTAHAKAVAKAAEGAREGGGRRRRPRRCEAAGKPALAALLGGKGEADVDAAADELLRIAGLTPAGKARLRDGRTGQFVRGRRHGRLDLHAEAVAPGGRQDPRAVASDRTRWSRSSRSPARRSSAASGSERWKCGRSRRTAPRTCCRRC